MVGLGRTYPEGSGHARRSAESCYRMSLKGEATYSFGLLKFQYWTARRTSDELTK